MNQGTAKRTGPLRIISLLLILLLIIGLLPTPAFSVPAQLKIWILYSPVLPADEPVDSNIAFTKLHLYSSEDNAPVPVTDLEEFNGAYHAFAVDTLPGTYRYEVYMNADNGEYVLGKGEVTLGGEEDELWLVYANFNNFISNEDAKQLHIELKHQDGRHFAPSPGGLMFFVPAYNGDSYYTYEIIPNDLENYVPYTGHFYAYDHLGYGIFKTLNLSDQVAKQLAKLERREFTVRAPKGMEVAFADQIHFYTARNFTPLEKDEAASAADLEYDIYYADHYHMGTLMLRQPGKVTRYCEFGRELDKPECDYGTWNTDYSTLTLRPLTDDPYQVNRDYFEANFMLNTDYSRTLTMETGTYFDLTPLRGWQAVLEMTANKHFDPDYHYTVLGDSVTVEQTADDPTWQFGRIKAETSGISLVLFTYDALEYQNTSRGYNFGHGFHCYSALWPENTGVQIVKVDPVDTGIQDNIDLTYLDTVYFLRDQTDEQGNTVHHHDYAEYTFKPTSKKGETLSVRVHDPYMIENGVLNYTEENWLEDGHWTDYSPDEEGNFTVHLKEGRNIVEISTASGAEYRVLNAHSMDVVITNKERPGSKLATLDTATIKLIGLQTAVFKLGAVFNPVNAAVFTLDGMALNFGKDGFRIYHTAECDLNLDQDGVYELVGSSIHSSMYALEGGVIGVLSRLTRTSMRTSEYNGQDSPVFDSDHCILPSFSFAVEDSADIEELRMREAGKLSSWLTRKKVEDTDAKNFGLADTNARKELTMTAVPADPEAKLYIRWYAVGAPAPAKWSSMEAGEAFTISAAPDYGKTSGFSMPWCVQVLVVPESGYPFTYSRILAQNKTDKLRLSIDDITITAASGSGALGTFDGELKAKPVNCACGEEAIEDLGYGFIYSEENYTASVPYETDQIDLNLFSRGTKLTTDNTNTVNITISRGDGTPLTYGDPIPLDVGENTLLVKQTRSITNPAWTANYEYSITVTRRAAPKTVSFVVPDGASVLVQQGNKAIDASEDGSYALAAGAYTYYVSKPGCLTKIEDFTVKDTDPEEIIISVPDLELVQAQSGSVSVRIAGQDAVIVPEKEVEIDDDPEHLDLASLRYVRFNHGGYTVLHALIDACGPASFTCRRGIFAPEIEIDEADLGTNAGWVCEVNGKRCMNSDLANTLVYDGDTIDFYYDSDYAGGMQHARFKKEAVTVTEGSSATLTLLGTPIGGEGITPSPIKDADIYLGNTFVGKTDEDGKITISAEKLNEKRTYFVTAKDNSNGNNALTCAVALITVVEDTEAEPDFPGYSMVTFRLVGDTNHGDETQFHDYSTWIGTTTYAFADDEEITVGDVFARALSDAGYSYVGIENGYISSIITPDGDRLSEKDNGVNSGWMFTVNGIHSSNSLNETPVFDGYEIVWHYVDDYILEEMDNNDGSTGNTSTWNTWMDADDGPSVNPGVIVEVKDAQMERVGTAFTATLPYGTPYSSESDIYVVTEDTRAVFFKELTQDSEDSWSFGVRAENGTERSYTLSIAIGEKTAQQILTEVKAAIEDEDWTVDQAIANDADLLKGFVESKLAKMDLSNADWVVTITDVSPAKEGTAENTAGKAGSYEFTVALSLMEASATAEVTDAAIRATEYVPPTQDVPYKTAMKGVLNYLAGKTKNPGYNDEWVVFALNRGGMAEDDWNDLYFANLQTTVDENDGILSTSTYTEYSRVVLALTAAGIDATQFATENETYDLVKPLLDKQNSGTYIAEQQGNNGTMFALLALDSHGYYNTAEGNAARAALIASLKKNQLTSGAWSISGNVPDLDLTAAGIYALAPYYNDPDKLDELDESVTYEEVTAMVDKALKYLSGKRNDHGGFGSAEADAWALIALSSIGRDADEDPMFVKAEGSLLDDLLRYYDESSGGFLREDNISHAMKVNAMSSEQAAYGLVAYDRFVENRNALYDMSDVEIMTLAQRADLKAAQAVEELIDGIGEVTLKSSAAISAARSAYNALTSEQKALVSNLKTLTDAEAAYKNLVAQADQEEIDKNAAESVDAKIDAIGTVTLDSEKAITAARTAYNALTDAQKKLVEGLAVLEAAEAKLAELKENAKTLATVTFRLKGGASKEVQDSEEIIYTKGELGDELPTAERDGYTFDGWFDAPVGGTQHTKVTASLPEILYAQWTSNGGSSDTITVSFVLYGDTVHASNVGPHTLADSTLTEWIPLADYQVDKNATVLDVFELALTKAGLTWDNPGGNYITSVTNGDIKLAEFTNGNLSGWKYTLNGIYSSNGVSEQSLTDGDCILFHYTDDYTVEANMTGNAVQSMTMIPETLTVETGKTGELRVSIEPTQLNGSVPVVWTSSETAIASVDKNGVVTGLAEGEATITAKSEATGFSATAKVTVVAGEAVIAVESVTVSPTSLSLKEGETGTLTATVLPENATAKDVQWTSSNEAVATVKDGVVTAVKAGTATITATAGGKSAVAAVTVEAEEQQDTDEVTYTKALNSVLKYLEEKVPNPKLAEISGEWAVFALNRGDAAKDAWNDVYLENLTKSLDDVNGVLAEGIKYSGYSRVILALTSMGVDASQVTTDKATYDLVKPLLDKDEDGSYMVEAQGNNGTIFALLALDSHGYLPGAEGKALRAELIDSLKENQLDSGAWAISGKTAPDLDMTAAAVYALAPYYNDPDKLTTLGGTVTHAEVKAMVDGALAYLSKQQAADGGFGSAEADVWAIIALSSVGRDADTDEMFVKADGSLLDDLLSYYDASSGGFLREDNMSHAMKVNQMSSEQAAYGLVAYDRFKKGKTALYDMSDVEIKTLEEKANKAAAEEVEDLINAIGEVTLESKAKIDAARAAYDALTDAQKKLVSNLKTLTDAEAAYEKLAAEADQEEVDKAAAKGVEDLIEAIGEVTLDSEKAIKAARSAYDALTDAQKKLVENLAALETAEKTLAALKDNAEKIATVTFHLRNGTSDEIRDGEEITYTKGDLGKALPSAKRDGYSFQGWFDFPTDGAKFTEVTADLPEDLYAQWKSNSSGGGEDSETKISVTFRLIGAEKAEKKVDLGAEEYMPDYVTWIATTTYELDEGDTVYDLWVKALREHGLSSEGAENNYVKTVYAPASLGGYALSEFTNGPRSGWMYTINGRHPGYGLVEQELKDGDRVIWHYVNDYSYEVADWFGNGQWAALGDGRYYNRWLKAPDRFGGAGGGLGEGAKSSSSGGSGDSETSLTPSFDGDTVWLPAEVDRHPGGAPYSATAVLTNEIVTEGLEKAEDKSRLTLWVEIEDSNGLVMKIDPEAVKTIADTGAGLRMECRVGVIELSAEDVAKLAESGNEVRFAVSYDDWNYKARMSVTVNHKAADVKMKIELPAPDGSQALAIVNSDSSLTVLKKSAVIVDRAYAEITGSASLTFVDGIRRWDDVKKDDWYYNAVAFMVAHELMTGVDRFEFAPKSPMTRAMLVTVLYRLEDLPEIIGDGADFGDVDSESWYADAVAWASETGIVNGTDRGFEPNANITREQIATILYRYAKYIGLVGPDAAVSGDVSKFGDGEDVSPWAQEAMAWAVEVGLFKGDDTGSLNPQGNATRAEVATLIERLIKLIVLS